MVNLQGNATVVAATANYVFLLLLCSHCPLLSPRGGQASGVSMQQQQHLYHSQTDGEVAEEGEKKKTNKRKYERRIIPNVEKYHLEWSDVVHSETDLQL